MELSIIIAQKIFMMFLLSAVGYIAYKIGMIDVPTSKKMSAIALKLVTPAVIFVSYQMEYDSRIVRNLGLSFLLSAAAYVIQIGFAFLLAPKGKGKNPGYRLDRLCMIFSNAGFFGIPLINSLYGSEGTVYITAFTVVLNILLWSVGVPILVGKTPLKETIKNIFSPSVIATILGFAFLFLRIRVPEIVMEPIRLIAGMNTPFAMIVAGSTIAGTKILPGFKNPRLYYTTFCKMLLIPTASVLVFRLFAFFPIEPVLLMLPILAVSCPTAAACPMLAILYDQNSDYASQLFAVTTILSIVTIPLIYLLAVSVGI